MSQTQTVRLKVNEVNLIGNLKYAFSNKAAVLAELMQNARRAKATKVMFWMTGNTLIVEDDGRGISDMQHLFHVAESGWDAATKVVEKPYGMGWLSCLFSASRVTVESRGKRISFDVNEAIGFRDIEVKDADSIRFAGTRLMLEGFALSFGEVAAVLKAKSMGFDIDVIWEGTSLDRPYALSTMNTSYTAVGHVSVAGIHFGEPQDLGEDTNTLIFLQGLPIYGQNSHRVYSRVVHLDSTRFHGVMPDRDRLHEEKAVLEEVDHAIRTLKREYVLARKAEMSEAAWVSKYWTALQSAGAIHLTFDIPYLPLSQVMLLEEEVPLICSWGNDGKMEATKEAFESYLEAEIVVDGCIPRQAFEEKSVILANLPYVDEESAYPAAFAIARANRMLVTARELPEAHWAKAMILNLDHTDYEEEENARFEAIPNELKAEGYFSGNWVYGNVQVASSFKLAFKVGEETVTEVDMGDNFVLPEIANASLTQHIFCVTHPYSSRHLPRLVEDYCDEWGSFEESDADNEQDQFARYVRSLVVTDAAEIFKESLQECRYEIRSTEALRGKSFTVKVDENGEISVFLQDTVSE